MANGTLSSALFEGLADELIVLIARRVGHVELCRLACVSNALAFSCTTMISGVLSTLAGGGRCSRCRARRCRTARGATNL